MEIIKTKKEHKKQIEALAKELGLAEFAVKQANKRHKQANDSLFEFLREKYPEIKGYKMLEFNHEKREIILMIKKLED